MTRAGPDHYVVLGVAQDATVEEIRRAYRAIARHLHPDVSELADNEPMAAANEAWYVLGDDARRAAYDQSIASYLRDPPTIVAEPPFDGAAVPRRTSLLLFFAALMCAVIFVLIFLIGFTQGPGAAP